MRITTAQAEQAAIMQELRVMTRTIEHLGEWEIEHLQWPGGSSWSASCRSASYGRGAGGLASRQACIDYITQQRARIRIEQQTADNGPVQRDLSERET